MNKIRTLGEKIHSLINIIETVPKTTIGTIQNYKRNNFMFTYVDILFP